MTTSDPPAMVDLPSNQQVAIVGIGCRFGGGVDSVDKFWTMLSHGLDCTSTPPDDRFDCNYYLSPDQKLPGKIYSKRGGFLQKDPYMFDRKFFKISPDEADHLDPQVRLLLEVTWEALEDSGIPASSVRGSQTGVYMGVTASEYAILASMPSHNMNQYTNSGTNSCMMANRISYEFDFRGPSFSVDTACSSSLYAIHMACEALKAGSCSMAVAGGVNLVLMAGATIGFCQAGMLAPDGKCKSFDQSADGYSRSEGAGAIVLKTLSQAKEDGDRIYAVIRGGSLSNDGRTHGIATPSLDAQMSLIKAACENAKVNPADVIYSEAHGTGTMVGDRTEANALGQVMRDGQQCAQSPLYIGSVKSNIGHTEGAAGVAGIIKTALSLRHRMIPGVVHFQTPNKLINVEELNISFPTHLTTWPEDGAPLATCSSFGFGGANANLVLTVPPAGERYVDDTSLECWTNRPFLISAASKEALQQRLCEWKSYLEAIPKKDNTMFMSALYTAAQRSQHHQHRTGFVVKSRDDAIRELQLRVECDKKAACVEDVVSKQADGKIVFVFSGMGTQWWGMGRSLMQSSQVFASTIKKIDTIMQQQCGSRWSLVNLLTEETNKEKIHKTDIAQPCICAVQIGLVAVWKERGVTPDVVVGHSVGEVAAAYAAGLLKLEMAVQLIYHRGKLLSKTSGSGKMLAILHSVDEIQEQFQSSIYKDVLDVAAVNSPNQIVLSGASYHIDSYSEELKRDRIKCVKLKVDNAFHSRQQDTLQKGFSEKVANILECYVKSEESNSVSNSDSGKSNSVSNSESEKSNSVSNSGSKKSNSESGGAGAVLDSESGKSNTDTGIRMMSSVSCTYLTENEVNSSEYWWHNTRDKVRFQETVENLVDDGCSVFVEVGSHAALLVAIQETADNKKKHSGSIITTSSLLRPRDTKALAEDSKCMLLSHMKLHVAGLPSTFDNYFEEGCRNVVSVPLYPWQRERCSAITEEALQLFQFPVNCHPLLGKRQVSYTAMASMDKVWKSELNQSTVPWLDDHVIGGAVILPAAAYLEVAIAVAKEEFQNRDEVVLTHVDLQKFLFAADNKALLETTLDEVQGNMLRVTIRSHDEQARKWTQHGKINISIPENSEPETVLQFLDVGNILERCQFSVGRDEFYANESSVGLSLGPAFRSTTKAFVNGNYTEILCYCEAPEFVWWDAKRYFFHPALLDSCFQPFAVLLFAQGREHASNLGTLHRPLKRVPRSINEFRLYRNAPKRVIIHLVSESCVENVCYCDVKVADADTGEIFCEINGMKFDVFESEGINTEAHIWDMEWVHVPLKGESTEEVESESTTEVESQHEDEDEDENEESDIHRANCIIPELDIVDRKILVFPDANGVSETFVDALRALGIAIDVADNEEDPKATIDNHYVDETQFLTDIIAFNTLDAKGLESIGDITVPLSVEEFQAIENPASLFCVSVLQTILNIPEEKRPRVLFVTKGVYDVTVDKCDTQDFVMKPQTVQQRINDLISGNNKPQNNTLDGTDTLDIKPTRHITDPFLSSIHSILLTAVHEEPTLQTIAVDLPPISAKEDLAQIMHSIFLHLPPDENIISCRYTATEFEEIATAADISEWKLFSPRLNFKPASQVKVNANNNGWKLSHDKSTGNTTIDVLESCVEARRKNSDEVRVNISAIRTFRYTDDNSDQHGMLALYAGSVDVSRNANNNQSQEAALPTSKHSQVLGISSSQDLPSSLLVQRRLVSEIPDEISCAEAVSLAARYLPAKVVFEDVLCIAGPSYVIFVGNNSNTSNAALTILAALRNTKIVVIVTSPDDDPAPVDGVTYIMAEHINDISNTSFDFLVINETSISLPAGSMILLLQKLRRNGSVISLHENDATSSKCFHKLPSRIKFMTLNMSFPFALDGMNPSEIKQHLDELWQLIPTDSRNDTNSEIIPLTRVSFTGGVLPDTAGVIDMTDVDVALPLSMQYNTWLADDSSSYLVTGGTSGLGLSLVEWLVSKGARYIHVLSRRSPDFEAEDAFSCLRSEGAVITHYQGDIIDVAFLEEVLTQIHSSVDIPPLSGIFHFATTYEDGFIHTMSHSSWNSALGAKAYGALLLHQLTLKLGICLKHFVMASSLVSIFGNAGQSNYCAANNFVNGLCRMRHSMGLPATCLIIGYLNTVGFAVRSGLITAAEENGFISVSPKDVLGALGVALKSNLPELTVAGPLTVNLFTSRHRALMSQHFRQTQGTLSLLKSIYDDKETYMGHTNGSLRQLILDLPIEEARKTILAVLCNILSKQLGIDSELQDDTSPVMLGIDSLVASTLSQAIFEQFEVTLGAVDFLNENNTLKSLSNKILQKILRNEDSPQAQDELPVHVLQVPPTEVQTNWIVAGPLVTSPILNMVCFPPNGGGPSTFAPWSHYLTQYGIQLLFVQMPGWEGREDEEPLSSLEEMTESISTVLMDALDEIPFVFFGHSMGSLLAFEVSRYLIKNDFCPQHLFISSWYAPTEEYPYPEELDAQGHVFKKLGQMLGVNVMKFQQIMKQEKLNFAFLDDAVLNNRTLMSRMLPAVQAALRIAKAYELSQEVSIPCGITVFGGEQDPFVKPELLEDWMLQLEDESNFGLHLFPGKHMYILSNTDSLLKTVKQVLLEQGIALKMPQYDDPDVNASVLPMDSGVSEKGSGQGTVRRRERKGRSRKLDMAPVYESRCQTLNDESKVDVSDLSPLIGQDESNPQNANDNRVGLPSYEQLEDEWRQDVRDWV